MGRPGLPGEPQPVSGCVGAGFMPMAFQHGCRACFWVERSRRKNCTKGGWWEGPASSVAHRLPGRAERPPGSLGRTTPCYPLSAAPSNRGLGGLPSLLMPPAEPSPSTLEDSSCQWPSVCSEPHPATHQLQLRPLTCPLSWRPLQSSLDGRTWFCSLLHHQWRVVGVQEIAVERRHSVPSII